MNVEQQIEHKFHQIERCFVLRLQVGFGNHFTQSEYTQHFEETEQWKVVVEVYYRTCAKHWEHISVKPELRDIERTYKMRIIWLTPSEVYNTGKEHQYNVHQEYEIYKEI